MSYAYFEHPACGRRSVELQPRERTGDGAGKLSSDVYSRRTAEFHTCFTIESDAGLPTEPYACKYAGAGARR